MSPRPPPEWHITNEPDSQSTQDILAACRSGSQAMFADLYGSTSTDSLPPLSYCLYLATSISHQVPLVAYILSLDTEPPTSWPRSHQGNERTGRGLSEVQIENYICYSILSPVAIGDTALVQAFLDAGVMPNTILECRLDRADSLLSRAVEANQLTMARYLLARGANANKSTLHLAPCTVVSEAAARNLTEMLRLLLSEEGGGRLAGSWALWHAVCCSAFDTAEVLLELGADVNEVFLVHSLDEGLPMWPMHNLGTALHQTAYEGNLEAVKWLLHKGARLDLENGYGKTVFDKAAEKGNSDVREILDAWATKDSS